MIGEKIHKLRKRARMSQKDFAEVLGVTRQTIANWESNKSTPEIYTLKRIAKGLRITLDELLDEEVEESELISRSLLKEHYFFGKVIVGANGEIKLPQEAAERFEINYGDEIIVIGDMERGIELLPTDVLWERIYKKEIEDCEKNIFDCNQ